MESRIKDQPYNIERVNTLAIAKMELGDNEGALLLFKQAVEIDPSEQALNNLGYFYLKEGELIKGRWFYQEKKAIKILEKTILKTPKSHIPFSLLGEAYLKVECFQSAEKVLRQAVNILETVANQNNLGVALFEQNQYEEALNWFLKAHDLAPSKDYSYYPYINAGISLGKLNRSFEVEVIERNMINSNTSDDFILDIARMFYLIKDYQRTAELYSEAFSSYVVTLEDYGLYIQSLYNLGRLNEAEHFANKLIKELNEEIDEIKVDPDFDIKTRSQRRRFINKQIIEFQKLYQSILTGTEFCAEYHPYHEEQCYLFGCTRHNIPYQLKS